MPRFTLAVHGGAGTILKADMTPELEEAYQTGLQQALHAGTYANNATCGISCTGHGELLSGLSRRMM